MRVEIHGVAGARGASKGGAAESGAGQRRGTDFRWWLGVAAEGLERPGSARGKPGANVGRDHAGADGADRGANRDRADRDRLGGPERDPNPWAAFSPPPAVMQPPVGVAGQPPAAAGTAAAHAQVAALAERVLTSMRVGRVGPAGHEVRMRLGARLEGVEVRLRHEDGRITAELHAEPWARSRATRMAQLLSSELSRRGAELESIEVI